MARSAIPDFGIEYPAYEYHPWPKYAGANEQGEALIANNQAEYDEMKAVAFFPKLMGKDKNGKDVIAQQPRDLEWLKASVATPPEDPAVVAKREADAAFEAAETKRKAAAYDALIEQQKQAVGTSTPPEAAQNAANSQAGLGANAQNALTQPTGLKKTKAA